MMSIISNLSENVRNIKTCSGKSYEEFANELGISKSSLQSICAGKCNLRMDTLHQIADSLDTDIAVLLQEPYTEDQISRIKLILNSIEVCRNLSTSEREQLAELFQQILKLLDKSKT